jgi:RNA polymerase sigma-70 factor (ECF subfamily)
MTDEKARNETLQVAAELEAGAGFDDLEGIFQRHHGLVFRAAYRVTGNPVDAEDVLQTVFLRLLSRAPDRESVQEVESYLYRAAVNSALDVVRRRQRSRDVSLEPTQAAGDSASDPARSYSSVEIRQWLRNAIARLSPTAAEMFVLRFFEGKENPEIARMLGTTPATVAVTLHRTRERLQHDFRADLGGGQ